MLRANSNCLICLGSGYLPQKTSEAVPEWQYCKCVLKNELLSNLEKLWTGLAEADKISESPLKSLTEEDLYITSFIPLFRSHLRYIALRKGIAWPVGVRVISDDQLSEAWLANMTLHGIEVHDPDYRTSLKYFNLTDLYLPPNLLIIILGVKSAAMREMPELLAEAISRRRFEKKPTWVVDQPDKVLAPGHRCFSPKVMNLIHPFQKMQLGVQEEASSEYAAPPPIHKDYYNPPSSSNVGMSDEEFLKNRKQKNKGNLKRKRY